MVAARSPCREACRPVRSDRRSASPGPDRRRSRARPYPGPRERRSPERPRPARRPHVAPQRSPARPSARLSRTLPAGNRSRATPSCNAVTRSPRSTASPAGRGGAGDPPSGRTGRSGGAAAPGGLAGAEPSQLRAIPRRQCQIATRPSTARKTRNRHRLRDGRRPPAPGRPVPGPVVPATAST